mmetsp:Transcript_797/g.1626  ORF Transcript_797/g.1626 Transcript_797/m.1626 type:complete len:163 (-) Transcript_797:134-622(-)
MECVQKAEAEEAARGEQRKAAEKPTWSEETVEVTLATRPFGMTPSQDQEGYVVEKVNAADATKPAHGAGVLPGWKVVAVNDEPVDGKDLPEIQQLTKDSPLPVRVTFAMPASPWYPCSTCGRSYPPGGFGRKMLSKPDAQRRCSKCVEAAEAAKAEKRGKAA